VNASPPLSLFLSFSLSLTLTLTLTLSLTSTLTNFKRQINQQPVSNRTFDEVMTILDEVKRPLTIKFQGKIKVIMGAEVPISGVYHGENALEIHGSNGIGEVEVPDEIIDLRPMLHKYESAAEYLVQTCREAPGEISIIALGPLTNLAAACELDPEFRNNLKSLSMMGGISSHHHILPIL